MAGQRKKPADAGVVSRLAGRGEDALTRLMDELGKNSVVTDALARAMSAKGAVDERTRKTLGTVGLAAADEIKDLRGQLERLERRLSRLEGDVAPSTAKSPARRSTTGRVGTKKRASATTKRSTTTSTSKKTSSTSGSTSPRTSTPSSGSSPGGTTTASPSPKTVEGAAEGATARGRE